MHMTLSFNTPVLFVASVIVLAMSFVSTDHGVRQMDSTFAEQSLNSSAVAEDVAALGAESKTPEEGSIVEVNVETVVCLVALLLLLGFNHYQDTFGPRVKRVGKLKIVEERHEWVGDASRPRRKSTLASAKQKLTRPAMAVGIKEHPEHDPEKLPPWKTATAASSKLQSTESGRSGEEQEEATQPLPSNTNATPATGQQEASKARKPVEAKNLTLDGKTIYYQGRDALRRSLYDHAKTLNVDGLESTLQEMEHRYGRLVLMTDYSLVISHLGKASEAVKAHGWLRRAMAVGHMPSQSTFNSVINAYVKHGNLTQALHVADQMKSLGVEYDTITYNTIIEAWARAGDAGVCQQWMRTMLDSGVKASVVTFGSVMRACASAGLTTEIEEWYALSQELSIELNLICFCSVVNAFARRDDMVNATKWLTRCIESGVQPHIRSFTGMLSAVLNKGDLDAAEKLIESMRAAGVQPDSGVYSQCVIAATKAGQRKRAQRLADDCAACKLNLYRSAETALIQARLRVPNFKKAKKDRDPQATPTQINQTLLTNGSKPECEKEESPEAEETVIEEQGRLQATRMACVGNTYQGKIKEFMPNRFGYILCDETFALFGRDVLLRSGDNPELLAKGQRVSFTLRIDPGSNFPRASNVEVYRPSL